jgi:hypothetical protein
MSLSFRAFPWIAAVRCAFHARIRRLPLLGFHSLQRSPAQRVRFFPGIPPPGTLRPRSSELPRRLAPLHTSRALLRGPLLGFQPSGPCSSRGFRALSDLGCLLAIARPGSLHASNDVSRTRIRARFMTSRMDAGELTSRPFAPREAVPVVTRLEWLDRSLPSWFSPSLRFSPPGPVGGRRLPIRSRASVGVSSLASPHRSCTSACCQARKWRRLSRDRQPFRGFSPGSAHLFETVPCGVMNSPRSLESVATPRARLCAVAVSAGARWVGL